MTTLEKIRAEIEQHKNDKFNCIGVNDVLKIIDNYAEQDNEITISVRADANGYYPNVCGMCENAETELCDWCGDNKNFVKATTKIPDCYKKYADQEPISVSVSEKEPDEISEEVTLRFFRNSLKVRWKDFVIYNVEWLKKNWQMEMDIVCGVKPCDDAISRNDMLDAVGHGTTYTSLEVQKIINGLPSVNPVPCDDAVSREAVIEWLKAKDIIKMSSQEEMARKELKALPSVIRLNREKDELNQDKNELEPKTGHWREDIDKNRRWDRVRFYCSECGDWQTYGKSDYCPNCGCRMVETKESEEI